MEQSIKDILESRRALTLTGVPDGSEGLLLARLAKERPEAHFIFVARDAQRLRQVHEALRFFAPGLRPLELPAWDCLPYDRASPQTDVTARRVVTLTRMTSTQPRILLTTVNALMQRLPPRDWIRGAALTLEPGLEIESEYLQKFLAEKGYLRTGQVNEPGEFAVRGGLVDLYAPGADAPVRVDFFGDEIEILRTFDVANQRSTGTVDRITLHPAREFDLRDEAIQRFRRGYHAHFGAVTGEDPLYEAVTEARNHQGMEHWLPLFHERMETLFDYWPEATVLIDYKVDEAITARWAQITDYHGARSEHTGPDVAPYKALPPEALYIPEEEVSSALNEQTLRRIVPFAEGETGKSLSMGARPGRDFAPERQQPGVNIYDALKAHVDALSEQNKRILFACYSEGARERLKAVLSDHEIKSTGTVASLKELQALPKGSFALAVLALETGFETDDLALITETDVLGQRLVRKSHATRRAEDFLKDASALSPGDLVVHVNHGIGRFDGLETVSVGGADHDCLKLVYHGGDRLYLPVENIEMLTRYGSEGAEVRLDRLGGSHWQARHARLKKRIREIADNLIKIAARRHMKKGVRLDPPEGLYDEFCARFPYAETEDQDRAIRDVVRDLGSGRPMDRLICGDVGFGKTEVALRAAFIAALGGVQVALIAPTTLLVRQHLETFRERFRGLPVRIEALSRLQAQADRKTTREGLADGQVDIVIGTHALLGKAVKFKNLGLVIVDEEQHFGVRHKERLKELRAEIHVLTMTATPIPRTMQLALAGIRDLSIIATPPVDRLAIRTFVMPFDPLVVKEALLREHYRGGQSFYVAPRIADLPQVMKFIREELPGLKPVMAHGQMPAGEIDDVMNAFYDGKYDALVSTTIIESGLDIPSVNTMVVHRADMFGLAQLYQLRGRIGRSKTRAYAYLTVPDRQPITDTAEKRLKVLQSLDTLGAGFSIASHDLDIRGAGNILGEEQSGQIREVGVELYQQMLEEAVARARSGETGEPVEAHDWSPQINIGATVMIPEDYVNDLHVRMALYRRLGHIMTREEIDAFAAEMIDRFGPLPRAVKHLLAIVQIKGFARRAGIERLEAGPKGLIVHFRNQQFKNPAGLVDYISKEGRRARLRPDHSLVYKDHYDSVADRIRSVAAFARRLAHLAEQGG